MLAPTRIGHFTVEREIGRGGMGVVLLARDDRLGRRVALKLIAEGLDDDPEHRARFDREARLLASLSHPCIAAIHGLEIHQERTFLVLEYVQGCSLADLLQERRLSVRETMLIGQQMAAGLAAAHREGIVHRDLKPGNVMVTDDMRVKLLDFGLARRAAASIAAEGGDAQVQTRTGMILGSPGYMAPEQVRGQVVDERGDLWALGCILYECLTGSMAFKRDNTMQSLIAIVQEEPDLGSLPPETPARLRDLIITCMAKEPGERVLSATDIAALLEAESSGDRGSSSEAFVPTRVMAALGGPLAPSNLPEELTSFIGRERELEEARKLLDGARLLTLTGSGGCGKTRMALRLAGELRSDLPGGVWLIEMSNLSEGDRILPAILDTIGVKEDAKATPIDALTSRLEGRRTLLVLDNCEHLLAATGEVTTRLLRSSKFLRIMATSREALGVQGEVTFRVPSLELPPTGGRLDLARLAACDSVRLFCERAVLARPGFALGSDNGQAVARICRSLDGIPLAIELAAARVRMLTPEQIEARLDDRFRLLRSTSKSAIPRQQTLRALIDWSYDQLEPAEQTLLARLSVFAGGFDLGGAESVTPGGDVDELDVLDLLSSLVEKSLVVVDETGESGEQRYRLLETVRQYAREKLVEAGELEELRDRHASVFEQMALEACNRLWTGEIAVHGARLRDEDENVHAALDWMLERPERAEASMLLATELTRYWYIAGQFSRGQHYLQRATGQPAAQAHSEARARALAAQAHFGTYLGRFSEGERGLEEALAIAEEIGDQATIAQVLHHVGVLAITIGENQKARTVYERVLELVRATGDRTRLSAALHNSGMALIGLGEYESARPIFEEALAINRESGNLIWQGHNLGCLGEIAAALGDNRTARSWFMERVRIYGDAGDRRGMTSAYSNLGGLDLDEGDLEGARAWYEKAIELLRDLESPHWLSSNLGGLSRVLREQGQLEQARAHLAEAMALVLEVRHQAGVLARIDEIARVAEKMGETELAARLDGALASRVAGSEDGGNEGELGIEEAAQRALAWARGE